MQSPPNEEWRQVVGFPMYEVSNLGRVHSYWYNPPRLLKCGGKKPKVELRNIDGPPIGKIVAALVAEAFIGPRPENCHVHHMNEDQRDNRVTNLEYRPARQHIICHLGGDAHPKSKLTPEQVRSIRREYAEGPLLQRQLAAKYGVSRMHIRRIVQRHSWEWLP